MVVAIPAIPPEMKVAIPAIPPEMEVAIPVIPPEMEVAIPAIPPEMEVAIPAIRSKAFGEWTDCILLENLAVLKQTVSWGIGTQLTPK